MTGGTKAVVGIIDYGMGNLGSVANAFSAIGALPEIFGHPEQLLGADMIVLPGVGAFGDGIANLRSRGWLDPLEEAVRRRGKPFLGICLGMQLLATFGTEHGRHDGLNWISGGVHRLKAAEGIRIPHIGWNDARVSGNSELFKGLGESQTYYFVHSYVFEPEDQSVIAARTDHGSEFVSAIASENIFATQFHPEKSQRAGLAVLRNFVEWSAAHA